MKKLCIVIFFYFFGYAHFVSAEMQNVSFPVPLNEVGERRIVVVIASYNNINYFRKNLSSVFDQRYANYHIMYIDDSSTDGTYDAVKNFVAKYRMQEKVTLIKNEKRCGSLHNQYYAIHQCNPTDLIIILDGDDWLFDNNVFSYINSIYQDHSIWLTYGQFVQYPNGHRGWCVDIPKDVVMNNGFREFTHVPSHLRTFYAGLFQKIKKEDLLYNKDFFRMSGDIAAMFPMIEMAREGHFKFIPKILLVYNAANPLNNYKVVHGLERTLDLAIRRRKRYDPIKNPFEVEKVGHNTVFEKVVF